VLGLDNQVTDTSVDLLMLRVLILVYEAFGYSFYYIDSRHRLILVRA